MLSIIDRFAFSPPFVKLPRHKNSSDVDQKHLDELKGLYSQWAGEECAQFEPLPQSGSYREYYRMSGAAHQAIGSYNEDLRENKAFISFTRHFSAQGLPVPQLLAEGASGRTYLLADLGDQTLFSYLAERRKKAGTFPGSALDMYKKVLEALPRFQATAAKELDYSVCYPRAAFDRQSMAWDLNYFKYYFLKLAKISFDEQLLENDFEQFIQYLLQAESNFFLYRDFQSRNIMIHNEEPWFIDYQGGRKGALQYDVASLLYDSKANIPEDIKDELLDHYLKSLEKHHHFERASFVAHYQGFVLIRVMQAMGAYGFRGFYERKTRFLESIPYALKQLDALLAKLRLPVEVPHLIEVLKSLSSAPELQKYSQEFQSHTPLTVTITSFSYRHGIPENAAGDGGGFVFDCRCIHNPGRYEQFKALSGLDAGVQEFFLQGGEAGQFLHLVFQLVEQGVEKYLNREFKHLQVSFGCTGGQHRSVYSATKLAEHLKSKYENKVIVQPKHRELEKMGLL
jgi:aminoglycoside/choline kinase family phosphotransferase